MSGEQGEVQPTSQPGESESDLPSWRRIGEFIRNILRIERSVEALKKENQEFEQRVAVLSGRSMSKPGSSVCF